MRSGNLGKLHSSAALAEEALNRVLHAASGTRRQGGAGEDGRGRGGGQPLRLTAQCPQALRRGPEVVARHRRPSLDVVGIGGDVVHQSLANQPPRELLAWLPKSPVSDAAVMETKTPSSTRRRTLSGERRRAGQRST